MNEIDGKFGLDDKTWTFVLERALEAFHKAPDDERKVFFNFLTEEVRAYKSRVEGNIK